MRVRSPPFRTKDASVPENILLGQTCLFLLHASACQDPTSSSHAICFGSASPFKRNCIFSMRLSVRSVTAGTGPSTSQGLGLWGEAPQQCPLVSPPVSLGAQEFGKCYLFAAHEGCEVTTDMEQEKPVKIAVGETATVPVTGWIPIGGFNTSTQFVDDLRVTT
ncbi:uncharacterized protein BCR38DRAFT_516539 [Pseudomassariella vexata]|uniref:Uncharacterized protein n=1 Tax=Pseudomassariella vexata TaxID=1141098 RepID=A0A1Y2DVQ0_9PEZI|nr:uncharacterized protein BCR38DRAFT_516539 [Pseudomassariella vexata]ORY63328.1 hypothetical protein BCR38DRAFT_516539 [Pseudomassariella vexata]